MNIMQILCIIPKNDIAFELFAALVTAKFLSHGIQKAIDSV